MNTIYSSEISKFLIQAEQTTFAPHKIDNYCKAAKLQVKAGLGEEAKKSYASAQEALTHITSDHREEPLKVAKIGILVFPGRKPPELTRTEQIINDGWRWVERQPLGYNTLRNTYAKQYVLLAKRFFQMKDSQIGNRYIEKAMELACEPNGHFKIAKVYKKADLPEKCLEVLKKIQNYMLMSSDHDERASWLLTICRLAATVNKEFGRTVLATAEAQIKKDFPTEPFFHEKLAELTELYKT